MDHVITAVGLACSVGHDVVTASAAIRAGLSLPTPLNYFGQLDAESNDSVALTGHATRGLTDGFATVGRWIQMAARAVRDLIGFGRLPDIDDGQFWRNTGVVFVTPSLDAERFDHLEQCRPDRVARTYVSPLLEMLGAAVLPSNTTVLPHGRCGVAQALAAGPWAVQHNLERLLIVAADTWLDAASLEWLAAAGRLKGPDSPIGLPPGEAAATILLERRGNAERRGVSSPVSIAGVDHGETESEEAADEAGQAQLLARVTRGALSASHISRFRGDVIVDVNGEPWRARQLALALARLQSEHLDTYRLVTPASSVGDTGAASGALGIAYAVRAIQRNYSYTREALVLSTSESGRNSAIVLRG